MSFFGILVLGVFTLVCGLIGQGTNGAAAVATVGFFIGIFVLYFCPALVAAGRGHKNKMAILVLNLLLGWTLLGWIGALVWSYTGGDRRDSGPTQLVFDEKTGACVEVPYAPQMPGMKKCPYCAEDVKAEAIRCKHCQADLSAG